MTGEKNKMDISALITEDQILIDLNSKSKKNILEIISQKLACDNLENKDIIFNKLYEREKLGTTAFGNGIAIPHARIPNLKNAKILFIKLSNGINFDSIDNKNVDIFFSLIVPDTNDDLHVELLAKVAEILDDEEFRRKIRKTDSKLEIRNLLVQNIKT
tara:strand:+ start:38 stop:514 length:477 start_codon:yes stop_codon:yes gene_type:complete